MKNKKLMVLIPALMAMGLTSCGKTPTVKDENTINVKLQLGGYGSKWLYDLKDIFEETYKDLGYKINIIKPTNTVDGNNVFNELTSGYAKKTIDLYFTGSLFADRVYNGGNVLVEPLDDLVYNQKALNFDGSEEEKKVSEKLDSAFGEDWYKHDGVSYGFFYQKSIGAMMFNRDKLEKLNLGLDYTTPITSNQLFEIFHKIVEKRIKGQTKVSPLDYVRKTGYASVLTNTWFAQLSGINAWDTFWSMNNPDGSYNTASGYDVYKDEGLYAASSLMFETLDWQNLSKNATNHDLSTAHSSLMASEEEIGGIFLCDGDWALNETAVTYPDEADLRKLEFINVPIASAVGDKLWGSVIADAKVRDNVLAKVASMSDEGAEVSAIKAEIASSFSVDLTEESILEACKARGIYNNRGVETGNAYVAKGISDVHKDIVGKLLRMVASDDFSKMYFSTARCFSPYSTALEESTELLPFSLGHKKIATHKYAYPIWPKTSGLRSVLTSSLSTMMPLNAPYFHDEALNSEDTSYNELTGAFEPATPSCYVANSKAAIDKNYQYIRSNWENWLANI